MIKRLRNEALNSRAGPLAGLRVVECFGRGSEDPSRAAVSFAGLLAAMAGAEVIRVEPKGGDPMKKWPPSDSGGSVLYAFLTREKRIVDVVPRDESAFLISDDPEEISHWPSDRVVSIQSLPNSGSDVASELTLMARAGLLDIFGSETVPPQPLPGHQIAYLGGLAAFNALLTGHLTARNGVVEQSKVVLLDVALWVNWKHYLAGWQQDERSGLLRKEDWTTLRCRDGYIALTFQDKDMASLARLTGDKYFLSPELGTRAGRAAHVETINSALEGWLQNFTRADISSLARKLRLPVGPVLSPREVLEDLHLETRSFFRACKGNRKFPRLPVLWNGVAIDAAATQEKVPFPKEQRA